ncbi:hypothetical protein IAQ61_009310 [Plenodomus lingam]|uniref:Rhodopsin domain-containing protein n=1 Tax=Leptosphaeria maculans (strain JN3 / isolate v23.1.3 / race Av1-4-5-6-7-8) TaxID=985895 RepID=E4ZTR4_LEPMJ|nr:hypothetical protein LEMA_P116270.1 [Plenodomus lingam JN3]KAH9863035.1 hypothetical protein IAQ61_009310 [Plenodomus lingam]CBX94624.1 hypothetical protein LEMA_P116270.1 [Plenodomus lingam JN3]
MAAVPNRGPELLGVNIAFVTTAFLACLLRVFVRIRMVRAWGLDDWLMVTAMMIYTGYITSSNIGVQYGTGRHHRDLPEHNVKVAKHCWYFCYLFYSISMICSKLSIGCLLLRISVRKLHTYIIYAAMIVSIVAGGTFFFVCLFQCDPVSYMWDKRQQGTCINNTVITALGYVYSIFSIISDFTFAIIPGFLVWHLQLKRRTKIALIPLITMGCIASAAVIARLPFIKHFNSPDFLWSTTDIAIWSSVEQGLAITAGSLATLRPLFFLAMHRLGLTTGAPSRHPSAYALSGGRPAHPQPSHPQKAKHETFRPDKYQLSATVKTRCDSDSDSSIPRTADARPLKLTCGVPAAAVGGAPHWSDHKTQHRMAGGELRGDNESERSLRMRCSEDEGMGIMVSKSFYITDEERGSFVASGEGCGEGKSEGGYR